MDLETSGSASHGGDCGGGSYAGSSVGNGAGVIEIPEQHVKNSPRDISRPDPKVNLFTYQGCIFNLPRETLSGRKKKRVRDPKYRKRVRDTKCQRSSVIKATGVIESTEQLLTREPLSGRQCYSDSEYLEYKRSSVINAAGVTENPEQRLPREPLSGGQCYSDSEYLEYKRSSVINAAGVIESPEQHLPREPLCGRQRDSDGERKGVRDPRHERSSVTTAAGVFETLRQSVRAEVCYLYPPSFSPDSLRSPFDYGEHHPLVNSASAIRDIGVISESDPKGSGVGETSSNSGACCNIM